jgi:hypothetical protein
LSRPVFASALAHEHGPVQHEDGREHERDQAGGGSECDRRERAHADGGHLERVVVPAADEVADAGAGPAERDRRGDEHRVDGDVEQHGEPDPDDARDVLRSARQPARGLHDGVRRARGQQHRGRGVDVPVERRVGRTPDPLPQVQVHDADDGGREHRREEQRGRERPDGAEVEVGRLARAAPGALDAGGQLGVDDAEQREERGEPDVRERGHGGAGHDQRDGARLDREDDGDDSRREPPEFPAPRFRRGRLVHVGLLHPGDGNPAADPFFLTRLVRAGGPVRSCVIAHGGGPRRADGHAR